MLESDVVLEKQPIFSKNILGDIYMQSIKNKLVNRIYGHGRGWAFSKTDFAAQFNGGNINQALSQLVKEGVIRRVIQGVYDYPRYSELLGQPLSPDIDEVAHALARKFNWRILPSGNAALNRLGLSTQVPGRWVYLSDGPGREYQVDQQILTFKKTALKDTGFKYRESGLIVQALKALGKERIDEHVIHTICQRIHLENCGRLIKDTRTTTNWIHQVIKNICDSGDGQNSAP